MRFIPKLKTIKSKIIHITLGTTFIITLSIISICYYSFHSLLTNSLLESTSCHLQLISNSLSSNLNPIINLSDWCSQKNILIDYLSTAGEPSSSLAYSAWQQLNEEYLNNASKAYISRIVIGSNKQNYLHVSSVTSFNAFNLIPTITNLPYFNTLAHSSKLNWFGIVPDPFSDISNTKMIPLIRPIYSRFNAQIIGWNYISISTNLLMQSLNPDTLPSDSQIFITLNDRTYDLLDPNFEEVPINLHQLKTTSKKNYYISQLTHSNGKKCTYVTLPTSINGWYLSQSLSKTEFLTQQRLYLYLVVLLSIIILSCGIGLALYLNQIINHPLHKLLHKINAVSQGNFSYDPAIEWSDEFGEIGKGINTLSKNVLQLMEHRINTEKEKKDLEYQILQSQINPHFLYNTLNSIKWMATIQNASGIAEMTTALSKLMRAVSKDCSQVVTLKDEIDLLNNYFLIQKYRYGGTISLNYDIQTPLLYNCHLPRFTLQPIVENAIFHGIEPKGEAGTITITACQTSAKEWHIEITDTGIGMSPEQINNLLYETSTIQSDFLKKIGIHNVNQRIKYTYGPQFGLNISSKSGCYTTVSIILPITLN